jgi:uncharacterized membrane protein (UPF0127 family)
MSGRLVIAHTLRARLVGMLSSKVCAQGETLMLLPCNSIHTYGMREPLDVAFVAANGTVLRAHYRVAPGRHLRCARARYVLERRSRLCGPEPWFAEGEQTSIQA